jgi:hypothetical protein
VQRELGWTNRTPSVFSTLSSREFQRDAGLELVEKRGGPASGGPSTTVEFVYQILAEPSEKKDNDTRKVQVRDGSGLKPLYGILSDVFKDLGGSEAFLKSERASFGSDPWEKLEKEQKGKTESRR